MNKQDLEQYIQKGVSPFHVVAESIQMLRAAGYEALQMEEEWELRPGTGYYICPYPSALYAFFVGTENVRIISAHTDQPVLKLKLKPTINREGNLVANVESYGGMILHTWFDRPLALAGKVVCRGADAFSPVTHLYDSGIPLAVVPSLAIHMDKEVNQKNPLKCQEHLLPLVALADKLKQDETADQLLTYVAQSIGVQECDILDYDLTFYNPQKPEEVGLHQELLVSPRLDNLTSCYAAVNAMVEKTEGGATAVMALFDNEEIGSRSKQGADSSLFSMILSKIAQSAGQLSWDKLIKNGFFASLDVAHGYHPNYAGKSDITTKTILGRGIVLKTSGSQRYSSDSFSNGVILGLCREKEIRVQRQINHSDIPGGTTLGPIMSSYVPIYGADIGVGVLGMHSACETAAVSDCEELVRFAVAFTQ